MEKTIAVLREALARRETEKLLEIWEENDGKEWSAEAFTAIERILKERGVEPPPRGMGSGVSSASGGGEEQATVTARGEFPPVDRQAESQSPSQYQPRSGSQSQSSAQQQPASRVQPQPQPHSQAQPQSHGQVQTRAQTQPQSRPQARAGTVPGYAGFWRRVVATILDGVLLTALGYAAFLVLGIVGGAATTLASYGSLLGMALTWLYHAALESSGGQATLGKRIVGVRVTDAGGNRISFVRASIRYFAKFVSALPLCIGFLMVGFTGKKQGLHDMIAGSLVMKRG